MCIRDRIRAELGQQIDVPAMDRTSAFGCRAQAKPFFTRITGEQFVAEFKWHVRGVYCAYPLNRGDRLSRLCGALAEAPCRFADGRCIDLVAERISLGGDLGDFRDFDYGQFNVRKRSRLVDARRLFHDGEFVSVRLDEPGQRPRVESVSYTHLVSSRSLRPPARMSAI